MRVAEPQALHSQGMHSQGMETSARPAWAGVADVAWTTTPGKSRRFGRVL